MKFVVYIERIVHAEVWTAQRKNTNSSDRRFEYETNPYRDEFYISIICEVGDGTCKAKMYVNNDQAVEIFGITDSDLNEFRAYDQMYDTHFTTKDSKTLRKQERNLTQSAKEQLQKMEHLEALLQQKNCK